MKVNIKIFKALNREPNIKQNVNNKPYNIFFATEEEKENVLKDDVTSILSSDGKEYRLLLDKEAYNFKINKEYYSERINTIRVGLIEKVNKLQKISLFAITLPVSIILITIVTIIIAFRKKWKADNNPNLNGSMWLIASLMLLVFSVSMTVNKFVKRKMLEYQDQMNQDIEKELGPDMVNKLSESIEEYNKLKNQKQKEELESKNVKKVESKESEVKEEEKKDNK